MSLILKLGKRDLMRSKAISFNYLCISKECEQGDGRNKITNSLIYGLHLKVGVRKERKFI